MPGLSFYSNNRPSYHHNTAVPPPPELSHFHDNFTFSDNTHLSTFNNGYTTTTNNYLPFHNNSIKYPALSSSYNPIATNKYYSNPLFVPNIYDQDDFVHGQIQDEFSVGPEVGFGPDLFPLNPMEQMQPEYCAYITYPIVHDVCPMDMVQPEIYQYGCPSSEMVPNYGCNVDVAAERNGEKRLSAQSMAARIRRRKISEKTSALGKLVPGGQKLTTAEMFRAAYKYIKFLQAQVSVLQLMSSSPELGSELQDLVTSCSVQEKLYTAEKCIVSKRLAKALADDHEQT